MRTRFTFPLLLGFIALTIAMTWPLLSPDVTVIPDVDDAYFSVWRLAWFAHQLPRDPSNLFDANIFYPARGTLAFSDAMLLVSAIGAPLVWAGITPPVVHNILLGAAFVTSMWFAFLLVRDLTGSAAAAWIAALIFGFAPYRITHIGHLELQWVMWMPLSLWLLHRLIAAPSAGRAVALGGAVACQAFSSIYYGAFLSLYVVAAMLMLLSFEKSATRRRVLTLAPLAVLPLLLVVPIYGPPYMQSREELGGRTYGEITTYSATPADLLRVPPSNWLRGRPESGPAPEERSLFPGTVAVVLGAAAFAPPTAPTAWMYLGLTAVSIDGALGVNGILFPLLHRVAPGTTSLRAPARFGALVLLSVAVLAGLGTARIIRARPHWSRVLVVAASMLCLVEYFSGPVTVRPNQEMPTEAHRFLADQRPGTVVLELPVPTMGSLWRYETTYQVRSIHHWQPLLNGYSGFAPPEYRRTLDSLRGFPDEVSIERLRALNVRFVLLNRSYYTGEEFTALIERLTASPAFLPSRSFGRDRTQIIIVELREQPAPR
jgi:hypothetical protein